MADTNRIRLLTCLLLLGCAGAAQAQPQPQIQTQLPAQPQSPPPTQVFQSNRTAPPQPGSAPADAQLQELTRQRDQLARENQALQTRLNDAQAALDNAPPPPPAWLRNPPWLATAIPLLSAFLALIAVAWATFAWLRNRAEAADQQRKWAELQSAVTEAQRQIPLPAPAAKPRPVRPSTPAAKLKPTRVTQAPAPASKPQPAPTETVPASDPVPPASPVEPRPAAWVRTGNILTDYNRARTFGLDGGDAFKAAYRCIGLSCANLTEVIRDPSATLRFEESTRGVFLGVEQASGPVLIVPAFDKEFDAARTSLEGVFHYSGAASGSGQLLRPATATSSGSAWTLVQPGDIALA